MAFPEKLAWVQLAAISIGFAAYALMTQAIGAASGWDAPVHAMIGPLIAMGVLTALVAASGAIVVAVVAPKDANAALDERDRAIARTASARAYMLLALGLGGVVTALLFGASPFVTAHLLIALFVAAELVRYFGEAIGYRSAA